MKTKIYTTLVWLVYIGAAFAQPTNVVVPNALANVEGNSSMSDFLSSSSFRMQMVFDASHFASLNPMSNNIISRISFRIDGASTFDVLSTFSGLSATLSITPRGPDNLSAVFADNIGANPVTIYSGRGSFGGGYFPGQSPQPFGNFILVTEPFSYSPSQGNLLLDITAGGLQVLFPGSLDAQSTIGDGVSRMFAGSELALSGTADTLGLVTRFDFIVVPEPSALILGILGAGIVMLVVRRRRSVER